MKLTGTPSPTGATTVSGLGTPDGLKILVPSDNPLSEFENRTVSQLPPIAPTIPNDKKAGVKRSRDAFERCHQVESKRMCQGSAELWVIHRECMMNILYWAYFEATAYMGKSSKEDFRESELNEEECKIFDDLNSGGFESEKGQYDFGDCISTLYRFLNKDSHTYTLPDSLMEYCHFIQQVIDDPDNVSECFRFHDVPLKKESISNVESEDDCVLTPSVKSESSSVADSTVDVDHEFDVKIKEEGEMKPEIKVEVAPAVNSEVVSRGELHEIAYHLILKMKGCLNKHALGLYADGLQGESWYAFNLVRKGKYYDFNRLSDYDLLFLCRCMIEHLKNSRPDEGDCTLEDVIGVQYKNLVSTLQSTDIRTLERQVVT